MATCENWYERIEQALSKLNDPVPMETPLEHSSTSPVVCTEQTINQHVALQTQNVDDALIDSVINTVTNISSETPDSLIINGQQTIGSVSKDTAGCSQHTTSAFPVSTSTNIPFSQAPLNSSIDVSTPPKNTTTTNTTSTTTNTTTTSTTTNTTTSNASVMMRGLTMGMLMKDGLVQPGCEVLSFESMGEVFRGDLMEGGGVQCRRSQTTFPCLNAWVVACRKLLPHPPPTQPPSTQPPSIPLPTTHPPSANPLSTHPLECVKVNNRPLQSYREAWFQKHRPFTDYSLQCKEGDRLKQDLTMAMENEEEDAKEEPCTAGMRWLQECAVQSCMMEEVDVGRLGRRSLNGPPNVLVECSTFSSTKRLQPFTVTISSDCLLLMHFHSHVISCEALGYMAGKWDSVNQHISITHAYPSNIPSNHHDTHLLEYQIMSGMEEDGVVLAGWYHSHNRCQSSPSLRDVEVQMEHQFQLKGLESSSFQPCFSFIISPFHTGGQSTEGSSDSKLIYVLPPPEQRPLDYPIPMMVQYNIQHDDVIKNTTLQQMRDLVGGNEWGVASMFAPEERPIFLRRLKQAIVRFCPGRRIDDTMASVLSLI